MSKDSFISSKRITKEKHNVGFWVDNSALQCKKTVDTEENKDDSQDEVDPSLEFRGESPKNRKEKQ